MFDPRITILGLSGIGVLVQTFLFKRMSDQLKIAELKKEQEKLMKKMKKARAEKDLDKITEATSKMNDISMQKLQATMTPNFISSIPLMFVFFYLQNTFREFVMDLPAAIPYPVLSPLSIAYKTQLGWLGFYIISVMLWGNVLRKILGVEL